MYFYFWLHFVTLLSHSLVVVSGASLCCAAWAFIYLFWLCWVFLAAWALLSEGGGSSLVAVCGVLLAVASLVAGPQL